MSDRAPANEAAPGPDDRERCELHGQPLLDDAIPVFHAWCVETDTSFTVIQELHFPHAKSFVWGPESVRNPYPVRYCPTCREVEKKWTAAPGDWGQKQRWMRRGFDPVLGTPAAPAEPTIVTDYVWIERWARAFQDIGMLNPDSLEEYVRSQAAEARAEGAPLDATHRANGRWRTVGEIRNRPLLEALGVETRPY